MTPTIFFSNPDIPFMNDNNILDNKFIELINKLETSLSKTDDYETRKEIRYIISRDYYKYALKWLEVFREAVWYRSDLV